MLTRTIPSGGTVRRGVGVTVTLTIDARRTGHAGGFHLTVGQGIMLAGRTRELRRVFGSVWAVVPCRGGGGGDSGSNRGSTCDNDSDSVSGSSSGSGSTCDNDSGSCSDSGSNGSGSSGSGSVNDDTGCGSDGDRYSVT